MSFVKYNELVTSSIAVQPSKEFEAKDQNGAPIKYRYVNLQVKSAGKSSSDTFYISTPIMRCMKLTKDTRKKDGDQQQVPINAFQTPLGYPPVAMYQQQQQQQAPLAKKPSYPEYSCPLIIDINNPERAVEHIKFLEVLEAIRTEMNIKLFPVKNLVYQNSIKEGQEFFKHGVFRRKLDAFGNEDMESNPIIWSKIKKSGTDLNDIFVLPGKSQSGAAVQRSVPFEKMVGLGFEGRFILSIRLYAGSGGATFQVRVEKVILTEIIKNVLDKEVYAMADAMGMEDTDSYDRLLSEIEEANQLKDQQQKGDETVVDTKEEQKQKTEEQFGLGTTTFQPPQSVLPPQQQTYTPNPMNNMAPMQTPHVYEPTMQQTPGGYAQHNPSYGMPQQNMYGSGQNFVQGVIQGRKN